MRKRCDILSRLSRGAKAKRSLKIEQQEISTKHCKCEILISSIELIYTQQKVKKLRAKLEKQIGSTEGNFGCFNTMISRV